MVNWSKEHTVQDGWGRRAQNGDHAWRSYDIGIKLWFTDYFMSGTAAIIFSYSCIFFWNWCKKKSYELCLWKCWIGGGWFRLFPLIPLRKKVYLKCWQYVSTAFVSCAWGSCRRNDGFFRSATCCAVPDPRSSHTTWGRDSFARGRLMRETCKGNDTDLGNMTAVPQRIVCLCTLVFIGDAESILQVED